MRIHGASRMQVAYRRTQKKGGPGCQALLPCALVWTAEGKRETKLGGLGSSHTTPCGAAVPARPPTRS